MNFETNILFLPILKESFLKEKKYLKTFMKKFMKKMKFIPLLLLIFAGTTSCKTIQQNSAFRQAQITALQQHIEITDLQIQKVNKLLFEVDSILLTDTTFHN